MRQTFPRPRVNDLAEAVLTELAGLCNESELADQSVAITIGSRGVANIDQIARYIVSYFKRCNARPFIVPAMGSHGGATAEGQEAVLARFGITEETVGCPIRSSMDVVEGLSGS